MFSLLKHRTSIFWTGLIILLLCVLAYTTGVFDKFDRTVVEHFFMFKHFAKTSKVSDIAIVEVDTKDLKYEGLWPWGKEWYPYFVNLLYSYNPKAVLLLVPSHIDKSVSKHINLLDKVNLSNVVDIDIDSAQEMIFESDGFFQASLFEKSDGEKVKHISSLIKLICAYYNCDWQKDNIDIQNNYITIKKQGIPFLNIPVEDNNLIINLTEGRKTPHYNYFDILVKAQKLNTLNAANLKNIFENKVIIFSDNKDIYKTPLGAMTKGELLANAIHTIINEKFIRRGYIFSISFIFFSGILLFILLTKFNFSGRTLTWLLSFISIVIVCYFLFISFGIVVTVATPLSLITLLYININIYGFHQQRSLKLEQKKELLAREIKRRVIPNNIGKIPGIDLQVGMVESSEAGGDFYNLIKLNEDRLIVTMGTVSEVGLKAAQQIEDLITKLKVVYNKNTKMPSLYNKLNRDLIMQAREGYFVKLLVVDINFVDGLIRMVNAGQVPPFVIYPRSSHARKIKSAEPVPLGIYSDRRFDEQIFRLNRGDVFVILSEGMYETSQTVIDYDKIFADRNKKVSYFVDKIISESKKTNEKKFDFKDRTLIIMKRL